MDQENVQDHMSLWLCSINDHYDAFSLSYCNTLSGDHDPLFYVITGALHTDMQDKVMVEKEFNYLRLSSPSSLCNSLLYVFQAGDHKREFE